MTDVKKLKKKVRDSGLKASFIAEKLNVSRSGWYRKLNGRSKFTAEQIQIMCDILHITSLREKEDIFFATM